MTKSRTVAPALPDWLQTHEQAQIQNKIDVLGQALQDDRFGDAEKITDAILKNNSISQPYIHIKVKIRDQLNKTFYVSLYVQMLWSNSKSS